MEEEKNIPLEETPVAEEAAAPEAAEEPKAEEVKTEEKEKEKKEKGAKKLKSDLAKSEEARAALEKELAEWKEKHLRMAAEYENYRRRSQKEKDAIYGDAVSDVINGILPVLDNLDRAALYTDAEKVAEGLALTAKSAKALLSKLGVEEYGAKGDTFDPNLHNAVMHVEDETKGEGEIVEVFQTGYRKGDKIVRFAMVTVAN